MGSSPAPKPVPRTESADTLPVVTCAGFDTLDGVIRRDRRWLPSLLDYVSYTPNPALQVEAAKIAAILVDRLPHFPDLLMQPLGSGKFAFCQMPIVTNLPGRAGVSDMGTSQSDVFTL